MSRFPILSLFTLALILRLLFSFYFQQFYFGEFTWTTDDTYTTYLNPFLNLINYGEYMGDLYLEDSRYYAVPIYPFFLGSVYTIFGSDSFLQVMALIQSIIDSISTILIYLIILKVTKDKKMAFISGLIHATYPFVLVWVPISVTEITYLFLSLVFLYVVTSMKIGSLKMAITQGALVGLLVLTKQFLGLLIILPVILIILDKNTFKKKIILLLFLGISFMTILSPWIVRNYIVSEQLIILKGETVGIRTYGKDFRAFEKFANLFNQNITPLVNEVVKDGKLTLNKHSKFVENYQKEIQEAALLAHNCGPAFVERRISTEGKAPYLNGCSEEVIFAFNQLSKNFWKETSFLEAIETRIEASKKVYLKNNIENKNIELSKGELIKQILFTYRTVLLTLGIIGFIIILWSEYSAHSKNFILGLLIFSISLYSFIALILVHVEIRYLLTADLLISIFSSVPIVLILRKVKG